MAELTRHSHECFAHCVARGNDPIVAARAVGMPDNQRAIRALLLMPLIVKRINELIPAYKAHYSTHGHIGDSPENLSFTPSYRRLETLMRLGQ